MSSMPALQRGPEVKSQPYVCPICTGENYYGLLVWPDEQDPNDLPTCPNHRKEDGPVYLVPSDRAED